VPFGPALSGHAPEIDANYIAQEDSYVFRDLPIDDNHPSGHLRTKPRTADAQHKFGSRTRGSQPSGTHEPAALEARATDRPRPDGVSRVRG
jgi:hypothetical protein